LGIVTDYPFWFIVLCLLSGGIYSFFLYFKTHKDDLNPWLVRIMAAFRFLTVTILSFLLLSPLLKKSSEIIEKPLILFVQDNSLSIRTGEDSLYYKKEYPVALDKIINQLGKKNEVVTYSFGEKLNNTIKTSFTDKATDISDVFNELISRYSNRNIGAMILATDGIYNKGSNPFYAARNLTFPVYTIALGDTLFLKDIILKKAVCNRTAFLGDKFPMEIQIKADKCNGEKTEVSVIKNNQILFKKPLSFSGDKAFQKVNFILDASEKGISHYSVLITPVDNEVNKSNNRFEVFVEVRDTREKIVLLHQSPHPDITAIRQALESTMKYELDVKKINEFSEQPDKYDLIILYQLPSLNEINALSRFISSKTSLLFVLGTQTDLGSFINLKTGLQIIAGKNLFSESLPSFNQDFALFTTDKELLESASNFPPLLTPFGTYQYSQVSEILFYQKMGNVTSAQPLAMFVQNPGKKIGIIAGENLWKWRLSDYFQKGNHDSFNGWVNKIVQYLSVKEDRSLFRIKCNDRFQENETVEFEAELFNESYEIINQQDVNLTIRDEQDKSYPFLFGKNDKAYYLNAGTFPVGKYNYSSSVKVGKNLYQKNGAFVVNQMNLETMNLVADHNLLFMIAKEHDGDMVYPEKMDDLVKKITSREDIKPVIYTQKRFSDLVGNPWVFIVIIILLAAEWFMRKRNGIY
jgi:hypothetical protein